MSASAEYGTYTFDSFSFTSTVIDESDGQGGLGDNESGVMEVFGSSLQLTADDGELVTLAKIEQGSNLNPFIGAWAIKEAEDSTNILVFIDDTRYMLLHNNNPEFDDAIGALVPVSLEHGTYTWDEQTGAFSVDPIGESDGPGGLSDLGGSATLTFSDQVLTLTIPNEAPININPVGYVPTLDFEVYGSFIEHTDGGYPAIAGATDTFSFSGNLALDPVSSSAVEGGVLYQLNGSNNFVVGDGSIIGGSFSALALGITNDGDSGLDWITIVGKGFLNGRHFEMYVDYSFPGDTFDSNDMIMEWPSATPTVEAWFWEQETTNTDQDIAEMEGVSLDPVAP